MVLFIWGISALKLIEMERKIVVFWCLGRGGNGELVFNEYRISPGEHTKVLEMDGSDDLTTIYMYVMLLNFLCKSD